MVLSEVAVDIVAAEDEARFRDVMQAHHYLGAVPGMPCKYLIEVRDIEHRNLAVQLLLKPLRGIAHPARQLPNIESLAACNAVAIIFFCAQGR